jgi:magnesium chelatase subunit I
MGIQITDANAWTNRDHTRVFVPRFMKEIVEEIARQARRSPAVNQQSGVSARMSIANMETLVSNTEQRALLTGETISCPRMSDLANLKASSRGKIELTMSEEDGSEDRVIEQIFGEAVKKVFHEYFDVKKFKPVVEWFEAGKALEVSDRIPSTAYAAMVEKIPLLKEPAQHLERLGESGGPPEAGPALEASVIEFILEGLHVENRLTKHQKSGVNVFRR